MVISNHIVMIAFTVPFFLAMRHKSSPYINEARTYAYQHMYAIINSKKISSLTVHFSR
jgi:hypothetical protein